MVVARSCRSRRSPAASSCSPTSLMLPPDGASAPFCSSPITVSAVTDLPDPLSPTRHSVSRSLTWSEMPSMMRSWPARLPSSTARLSMSRTMLVMPVSRRHCQRQTRSACDRERNPLHRHCLRQTRSVCARERSDEAIHPSQQRLDCFVARAPRNDVEKESLAALALLHAGIERVAGGVADQIDAEDGDRQQQTRPED